MNENEGVRVKDARNCLLCGDEGLRGTTLTKNAQRRFSQFADLSFSINQRLLPITTEAQSSQRRADLFISIPPT